MWRFRCYVDASGTDVIDAWYSGQSAKLQAKFDTRLRYLQQQPRSGWTRPHFDTLHGECAGLGEIRFQWQNVQFRPIGFASGEAEFTLLVVAEEHEGEFVPRNTCRLSQRRKEEVKADRRNARDCSME